MKPKPQPKSLMEQDFSKQQLRIKGKVFTGKITKIEPIIKRK